MDYLVVLVLGVLLGGYGGYTWGARVKATAEAVASDVKKT